MDQADQADRIHTCPYRPRKSVTRADDEWRHTDTLLEPNHDHPDQADQADQADQYTNRTYRQQTDGG